MIVITKTMINRIINKWKKIPQGAKISIAYTISNIIQRSLSFITLPLFTRLLSTEQYGELGVYQSWYGIISIFITLNLAYGSFGKAMVKYEDDRDGYISSAEGISFLLAALFLVIYLPFHSLWNKIFELPTSLVCLMIIEIICTNAILLWSGKQRFEFKYKMVILVTMLQTIFSPLVAYCLVINSKEKGFARIVGYALANIMIGLFFLIKNALSGKKVFNRQYWNYALAFNTPLLTYYLSQVIFNQSDRIMISHFLGKDKSGIYTVAYTLAMTLSFVLNAINNSYVPWFYGKIKDNKSEENKRISLMIAIIMSFLLVGVIWFAPEVIITLAGSEYGEAVLVVPPVAISLILLLYSQFFINVEFYYEDNKSLVYASVAAAIVNVILNYFFINKYGIIAAAYTTLISYIIFALSNYVAMKKNLENLKIKDNMYDYKQLIILLIVLSLASIWGVLLYGKLVYRIIITIVVMLTLFINRKKLIKYFMYNKEQEC